MKYLLDTCTISELVRKRPNEGVLHWLADQDEETLYLSVLTIGELHRGIRKLSDLDRAQRLQTWVDVDLAQRFRGRILPVDHHVASTWGRISGEAARAGSTLPVMDSLIAATAITHKLVVVTRNVADLERCGALVHNPWT